MVHPEPDRAQCYNDALVGVYLGSAMPLPHKARVARLLADSPIPLYDISRVDPEQARIRVQDCL